MTKNELLALLEEIRKIEEGVALYSKHIKNTLYLSGFKKDKVNQVKKTLDIFYKESKDQGVVIKQLIDQIKKGKQDVY